MINKRRILEALINGDATALNQLPPMVMFCTTDNHSNGIYKIEPPHGQHLPPWVKSEMTKAEIEALQAKCNCLPILIEKNYE